MWINDLFWCISVLQYWLKSSKSTVRAVYIHLIWHLLSYCYHLTLFSWHDKRLFLFSECCLDNIQRVFRSPGRRSAHMLLSKSLLLCGAAAPPLCLVAGSQLTALVFLWSGGFTRYALYVPPTIERDMQTCGLAWCTWHRHTISLVASISQCWNFPFFLFFHFVKDVIFACVGPSIKVVFLLLSGRQSNLLRDVARVQCGYRCGHWLACGRTEGSQVSNHKGSDVWMCEWMGEWEASANCFWGAVVVLEKKKLYKSAAHRPFTTPVANMLKIKIQKLTVRDICLFRVIEDILFAIRWAAVYLAVQLNMFFVYIFKVDLFICCSKAASRKFMIIERWGKQAEKYFIFMFSISKNVPVLHCGLVHSVALWLSTKDRDHTRLMSQFPGLNLQPTRK